MWKRFFVVMIVALLFIPASASADSELDCQKGIATLKSELEKKHPKPVQEQLQKALKNAQKEDVARVAGLLVHPAAGAVEGRGHQRHAEPDHADETEDRRDPDRIGIAEHVEAEHVPE